MTYDGSGKAAGLALYVNGKPLAVDVVRDALAGSIATDAPLTVGSRRWARPTSASSTTCGSTTACSPPTRVERSGAALSGARDPVRRQRQAHQGTGRVPARLLPHVRRARGAARTAIAELKPSRSERDDLKKTIPTAMVMEEMKKPRDTSCWRAATTATRPRRWSRACRRCCRRCRKTHRSTG